MCIKKLYYGVFVSLWPMLDFMAYLEEHKHIWIKLIFTLCPDGTLWHQIWRIHMYVYISTARPCRGFSVKLKDKRYMENIFKLSWKYYSSENGKFTIMKLSGKFFKSCIVDWYLIFRCIMHSYKNICIKTIYIVIN